MKTRPRLSSLKRSATLLTLIAATTFASIIASCTDRGNPTFQSDSPEGISTWTRNHEFQETGRSQFSDLVTTGINIYTPPGYDDKGFSRPYPTLYLLSPFRGDQFFYLHNNLHTVLNRMIASGEIEPMIVVTVNGSSNPFGGSFYSNYATNGQWENLVSKSLVAHIDTTFNTFGTITSDPTLEKNLRAISGYEMAGYGAVRAMIAPDSVTKAAGSTNFGSVSAISAPLYFSDNTYGFPRLFDQALGEWGSYSEIDSSTAASVTSFLIAASIAFSPEDTGYSIGPDSNGVPTVDSINKIYDSLIIDTFVVPVDSTFDTTITPPDTTIRTIVTNYSTIDTVVTLPDTTIDTIVDTTIFPPDTTIDSTFIPLDTAIDTNVILTDTTIEVTIIPVDSVFDTLVVGPDSTFVYNPPTDLTFPAFPNTSTGEDATLRMFLPFDSTGAEYSLIWDLWTRHDMANVIDSVPDLLAELSGNILIMATQEARFNHFDQDTMFVNKLGSLPTPVTAIFEEYSGYDGFADETGSHFLFEALPSILKFHSDRFHPLIPAELQVPNYQKKYLLPGDSI